MSKRMTNQFACSSMMLPEHRDELEKMSREKGQKPSGPVWDEQVLELWEGLLQQSYARGLKVRIMLEGRDGLQEVEGVVCELDPNRHRIKVNTDTGCRVLELKAVRALEAAD